MTKLLRKIFKLFLIWVTGIISFMLLSFFILSFIKGSSLNESDIVVINMSGPIGSVDSFMSGSGMNSHKILKTLYKLRKSKKLKVLLLRVNSGGGTLPGTQEIYREISNLKKHIPKLKIIGSVSEIAASGAYYIISICDFIFANPGSMVGNIGVISVIPNISDFLAKIGVNVEVLKQGKYKDTGAWWKKMSKEEKNNLLNISKKAMEMFTNTVIIGRKEKIKKLKNFKKDIEIQNYIKKFCNGEIFLGAEAKKIGLIDGIGNFYDAYDYSKKISGLSKPEVFVVASKNGILEKLLGVKNYFNQLKFFNAVKVML